MNKKVGFVGWRGMVGSVLMRRLHEENDLSYVDAFYFSTSQAGQHHVDPDGREHLLLDAMSLEQLADMDVLVSCQGGDYTKKILGVLRDTGWDGYWIDAASAKRMDDDSIIVMDPINLAQIEISLAAGIKNFVGGNCSITLCLLGLAGLLERDLIESMSVMTYQAASGAGASHVRELLKQSQFISNRLADDLEVDSTPILSVLDKAQACYKEPGFPSSAFGTPLAGSLIPWIDSDLGNGASREEWKGEVEANKILGKPPGTMKVDGLCIRIPVLQCHSAAITMKLRQDPGLPALEEIIRNANEWVNYVPSTKSDSMQHLSPAAVSGSLKIAVGRLRKLSLGDGVYSVLTVGDQLLWGAAEPLRRVLKMLVVRS